MRALLVLLMLTGVARAAPWRAGAEARTDFPLDVGGTLWTEAPERVQLSFGLGWLPGAYVDAIGGTVVAFGGMTRAEADLVRTALRSSAVARAHVGWRPLAAHGWYVAAGYGAVMLGGGATSAQLVTAVTGATPPPGSADRAYVVDSTLHMLDGEMGWRWDAGAGVTVRASLGFAATIGAGSTIHPDFMPKDPAAQAAYTREAATKLDAVYRAYAMTPIVSIGTGWSF